MYYLRSDNCECAKIYIRKGVLESETNINCK